jgi:hypothetical protein
LGDHSAWLFDQCQQDVFGIDLVVAVALDDLRSTPQPRALFKSSNRIMGECSFSNYQT